MWFLCSLVSFDCQVHVICVVVGSSGSGGGGGGVWYFHASRREGQGRFLRGEGEFVSHYPFSSKFKLIFPKVFCNMHCSLLRCMYPLLGSSHNASPC